MSILITFLLLSKTEESSKNSRSIGVLSKSHESNEDRRNRMHDYTIEADERNVSHICKRLYK